MNMALWSAEGDLVVVGDQSYFYDFRSREKLHIILDSRPSFLHSKGWGVERGVKIHVSQGKKTLPLPAPSTERYLFLKNLQDVK